jgi:hypothetical protein
LKEDGLDILIEALQQDPNNLYWNDKDFFKNTSKSLKHLISAHTKNISGI